ncbi:MAG TPA: hypothetical protein VFZ91_04515 [Allosphingosinicella sp.]
MVFGSGDRKARISAAVGGFESAEMPKQITILGARFTVISESGGKLAIEVHSTMSAQPFGVVQRIIYR